MAPPTEHYRADAYIGCGIKCYANLVRHGDKCSWDRFMASDEVTVLGGKDMQKSLHYVVADDD
eukprot:11062134-Prorocentrum_lima.AAC.1